MGKKKVGLAEWSVEKRPQVIEPELDEISIVRQCELFDLARSSYYYEPCPESSENLALMCLIDEQYLTTPFYGYRRMAAHLRMEGHGVGEERIRRLMRSHGNHGDGLGGIGALWNAGDLQYRSRSAVHQPTVHGHLEGQEHSYQHELS